MRVESAIGVVIAMQAAWGLLHAQDPQRAQFEHAIVNLEYSSYPLTRERPAAIVKQPDVSGNLLYGSIIRRLAGEGPWEVGHYVPFMVRYSSGAGTDAWCDTNFNGDLTDDPPIGLSTYPGRAQTRSFIVDLRWSARSGGREIPVDSKVRVVLEPDTGGEEAPRYREQRVFGRLGTLRIGGKDHASVLLDGNGDGLYTKEFGDGLFVDLDDDHHLDVDRMSASFAPLGARFQMEDGAYEVLSVEPEGGELVYTRLGDAPRQEPPSPGQPAPSFTYHDVAGREVRLTDYKGRPVVIYFWASWCGACAGQAADLVQLYEKHRRQGLEILGVSFDLDREAMSRFRQRHGQTWPTSFSGHMLWEDPVGRLYQARQTGMLWLIDREGRLEGSFTEVRMLADRLDRMLPITTSSR
ncbi:MAG TPA: peroxiredoxin family protein [Candidatus Polarisedimenticolia bacterium]|nr:peroxiredoxin family protein [Candidatus Polarisedimenticolia bacterium]